MKHHTTFPLEFYPTALTIGTFDGLHRGHRALLERLLSFGGTTTVLTFANHPLSFLRPHLPPPKPLLSLEEKLQRFEEMGIDHVVVLPFDATLANMDYHILLAHFALTHLLLGEGSVFGKHREGTKENLARLSLVRAFHLEYFPMLLWEGAPISSQRIRDALAKGDTKIATSLLGRPI